MYVKEIYSEVEFMQESQTSILKMLLKNKGMPVNREGESEDREKESPETDQD